MKRILLILTVILTSASAVWAESNVTFSNLNEVLVEDNSLTELYHNLNFDINSKYSSRTDNMKRWIATIRFCISGISNQDISTGYVSQTESTNYNDLTSGKKLIAKIGQTVSPNWYQQTNAMFGTVFIDLNRDGDFEDDGETISQSSQWNGGSQVQWYTSSDFTISNDVAPGDYRIRFNVAWDPDHNNPRGYSNLPTDGGSITDVTITIIDVDEYTVADNSTVNLSEIQYYEFYNTFSVPSGSTLIVDIDNFDLTKISGTGNIVLDANTSLTDGKYTSVTGTLTVNAEKTLIMGSGEATNADISSFSNVILKGILHYNTQKNEIKNLTIPENETGIIFSDDMGDENSGYKISLSGTTTINSNAKLITSNHWNFKLEISKLTGSGTWEICGTGESSYTYANHSTERSFNTVNDASEFTGTINLNNSPSKSGNYSTVTVDGNLVECTLTKTTGDYIYYSGSNLCGTTLYGVILNGSSAVTVSDDATLTFTANTTLNNSFIINSGKTLTINGGSNTINFTGTVTGAGNIVLDYFPTASTHPTFNEWTGTIEFADGGSSSPDLTTLFNAWGNSNSTIKLNNVTGGYLSTYDQNNPTTTAVNPTLNILADKTLTLNNGNSNANARISKVMGAGTIDRQGWKNSSNHNLYITTLAEFTGTLKGTGHPIIVENLARTLGPTVNEILFKTSGTVYFSKLAPYNSKLYIDNEDKTAAYAWEEKTVSSVKGYYITESAVAKIINALFLAGNYMGTGVGNYTFYLNNITYNSYSDFENIVSNMQTLEDWANKTISLTINQPTTGYYRFKSKYNEGTGYYLQCTNTDNGNNANQTTTFNDATTVFYVDNNTIKSYSTGKYFGDHTRANYTNDTNSPANWTFTEGTNKGSYTLTSDIVEYTGQNLNGKILYGWSGEGNKSYADRNSEKDNNGHTDWILIPVAKDELPVIKAPGCTNSNPAILGNITLTSDVTNNITASAKFVDLSDATISASIDDIKTAVADVSPNAIIIAPEGTSVASETSNVLIPTGNASEYTCNNLQLNDDVIAMFGTDNTSFQNTNVTYTRGISANVWGTICLPYATSTDGDVSYYRLVESGTSNLKFEKVTDANTVANEPYLIKKAENAGLSIGAENQEFSIGVAGAQNGDEHNNFKMQGVLVNTSVIDGSIYTEAKTGSGYNTAVTDAKAYYFDAANNTFCKLNGRFNLKAFRAYLTSTSIEEARTNIGIDVFDNDQPTGISFIESEDGKTVDVIFDLNGRRLQDAKKGINIINGKKVIK